MKKISNNIKFVALTLVLIFIFGKILSFIYPASDPNSKECPRVLIFLIMFLPPFLSSKFFHFQARTRTGSIIYVLFKLLFVWFCCLGIFIEIDEWLFHGDSPWFVTFIWLPLSFFSDYILCQKRLKELSSSPLKIPKDTKKKPTIHTRQPIPSSRSNTHIHVKMSEIDSMDGHEFEYFTADLLRKLGYTNVEVTPASGDQGVDVLAEKDGLRYAFQCKCYSSDLGNTPVQEVHAGKYIYHCHVGVVITNRYFTSGAKEAAKATGILLWDRDKLQSLIESAS